MDGQYMASTGVRGLPGGFVLELIGFYQHQGRCCQSRPGSLPGGVGAEEAEPLRLGLAITIPEDAGLKF